MTKDIDDARIFTSLRQNLIPALTLHSSTLINSKWLPKIGRLINKYFYSLGVGAAFSRYDGSLTLYASGSDRKLYKKFPEDALFCNFGSGAFQHPRWLNLDFPGQTEYYKALQGAPGTDFLPIDLMCSPLRLPQPDESTSLIYCSHTIEHLPVENVFAFFNESYRILKPGGVMRIVVPSTDNDFRILKVMSAQTSIANATKHQFAMHATSHLFSAATDLPAAELYSMCVRANFEPAAFAAQAEANGLQLSFDPSSPDRHVSFWDYNHVVEVATQAGFDTVFPCYRGTSLAAPFTNLQVFDTTEPHISLFIDVRKGAPNDCAQT